jgi:hypothetical protein
MRLPATDGQPFTFTAAVLQDRAVQVIFGRAARAWSHRSSCAGQSDHDSSPVAMKLTRRNW